MEISRISGNIHEILRQKNECFTLSCLNIHFAVLSFVKIRVEIRLTNSHEINFLINGRFSSVLSVFKSRQRKDDKN